MPQDIWWCHKYPLYNVLPHHLKQVTPYLSTLVACTHGGGAAYSWLQITQYNPSCILVPYVDAVCTQMFLQGTVVVPILFDSKGKSLHKWWNEIIWRTPSSQLRYHHCRLTNLSTTAWATPMASGISCWGDRKEVHIIEIE